MGKSMVQQKLEMFSCDDEIMVCVGVL